MALTKEDLQAIADLTRAVVKEELEPVNMRLANLEQGQQVMQGDVDQLKDDIDQIKDDTAVTRETVNSLGRWVDIASDVLKIKYPVNK